MNIATSKIKAEPFLIGFATQRGGDVEKLRGRYCDRRQVWVVETEAGEVPIVQVGSTMLGQTHTKTMTQVEADDTDQDRGALCATAMTTQVQRETDYGDHGFAALGGTSTLTEAQQKADDQDRSMEAMAETSTVTKVRQEADDLDASLSLPELQTKTSVQQESDDQAGMLI
ncbi:MAG: hypothetical protein C0471_10605 [Erythrobacter sp.]|nr:hypothetical protein [Erythrobacter sp.]